MNRGIVRGIQRARLTPFHGLGAQQGDKGQVTLSYPTRDALVFHPVMSLVPGITEASTFTAASLILASLNVSGLGGIPVDGSVVGLTLQAQIRCDTVSFCDIYACDWDTGNSFIGGIANAAGAVHAYGGKVAGHYGYTAGFVYTGGLNNSQFKYQVGWGAGTVTCYIRVVGWWSREGT